MTWLSNDLVERLRDVATRPELATDRYVILRPIGRGGMGSVYAARDEQLGREVAIKVSNAAAPADDLDQRLRQEATVLARLEHPGIVPVHDAGLLDDGRWFYVMKLVRGETLADHAASLEHEAARLVVFERVAETVAFAHAAGIVHRDLKPSNVMVGQFGEVLVLDWGVARVLARVDRGGGPAARAADRHPDDSGDGTSGGTRMGTAGFMAPEQAHGDSSNAGPPADVYALGALLFWMWTGSPAPADLNESATISERGLSRAVEAARRDHPQVSLARAGGSLRQRQRARGRSGPLPSGRGGVRIPGDDVGTGGPLADPLSDVRLARVVVSGDARRVRVPALKKGAAVRRVKDRQTTLRNQRSAALQGCPAAVGRPKGLRYVRPPAISQRAQKGDAMKKPVLGLLLGAVLGAFDGLTALATPEVASQIVGIVIGSTIKGLIVGALVGWYAYRVQSLSKGLLVGLVVAAFFAFLVAAIPQPDGHHYWIEIMLPGSIVGLIVGYATQQFGQGRGVAAR